jgi:hypothetical protein
VPCRPLRVSDCDGECHCTRKYRPEYAKEQNVPYIVAGHCLARLRETALVLGYSLDCVRSFLLHWNSPSSDWNMRADTGLQPLPQDDERSDFRSGSPALGVAAKCSSSSSDMVLYISRDAPFSFDLGVSLLFADKAAPAAFCWAFDLAGMVVLPLDIGHRSSSLGLTDCAHHTPQ